MNAPVDAVATCVAHWRNGEIAAAQAAFVELVGHQQASLCALTLALTGGAVHLSEELAQETFIEAWKNLGSLQDSRRVSAWLRGIARNLWAKRRQRLARRTQLWERNMPAPDPPDYESPEDSLIAEQSRARLSEALTALPERYREPLILYYREDWSAKEIAAHLGLAVPTVDQRLHRGRKQLRHKLEQQVRDDLRRSSPGDRVRTKVAAIIAGVPPDAFSLSPTTSIGIALMTKKLITAIVFVGLALLAATATVSGSSEDSSPTPIGHRSSAANPQRRGATRPGPEPGQARKLREQRSDEDGRTPSDAHPIHHQLTRNGVRWTLNLDGNESNVYEYGWPGSALIRAPKLLPEIDQRARQDVEASKNAPNRKLQGQVVNARGEPVPNAHVMSGSIAIRLQPNAEGERFASSDSAATTDGSGQFVLEYPWKGPVTLTAFDGETWSAPKIVTGPSHHRITLEIGTPARIEGVVTKSGEETPAFLTLRSAQASQTRSFEVTTTTDLQGHFAFDALSEGSYEIVARAEGGGEAAQTPTTTKEIDALGDRVNQVAIELVEGALVAVSASPLPLDDFPLMAIVVVLPHQGPFDSFEAFIDAQDEASPQHWTTLTSAKALEDLVIEFDDTAAGSANACILIAKAAGTSAGLAENGRASIETTNKAFGCKAFTVGEPGALHEISVPLARIQAG